MRVKLDENLGDLYQAVSTLAAALKGGSIEGKLWIVERHRIREYLPEDDGDNEGT